MHLRFLSPTGIASTSAQKTGLSRPSYTNPKDEGMRPFKGPPNELTKLGTRPSNFIAFCTMQLTTSATIDDLILFVLFLCALWVFKWLFDLVHAGLIGQIMVGVLFVSLPTKELWPGVRGIELLGNVAVIMIIFEGGMSVKLATLKQTGLKAFLVATLGVVLPVGSGIGILVAMGYTVTEGIAGGAALASTSNVVGVALMQKQNILESRFGTLLTAATMIDDIYSLILLSIVNEIPKSGGPKLSASKVAWNISRTIVASIGTVVVGIVLIVIIKRFLKRTDAHFLAQSQKTGRAAEEHEMDPIPSEPSVEAQDPDNADSSPSRITQCSWLQNFISSNYSRLILCLMFFLCFSISICAEKAGASRLLGCFVAGMAFADVPYARKQWTSKVEPVKPLLEGIFFASIGFFLPIRAMFHRTSVLFGLGYAASSAITKFATALLIRPWTHGIAAGIAMITRGELGLILAQQAFSNQTISESCFIVVCWAVILCTLFPPFFFAIMIKRYQHDIMDSVPSPEGSTADEKDQLIE